MSALKVSPLLMKMQQNQLAKAWDNNKVDFTRQILENVLRQINFLQLLINVMEVKNQYKNVLLLKILFNVNKIVVFI